MNLRIIAIAWFLALADSAAAQLPVCELPEPSRPVHRLCLSGGRFLVAPILASLSVDHTIAGNGPIVREPRSIFAKIARDDTQKANPALREFLSELAPVKFSRLDTATGTFRMDVLEEHRNFAGDVVIGETVAAITIALPERIEGGYWRTPGVLQMAFWKGQRVRFQVAVAGAGRLDAEAECLALSSDGVRLVTADAEIPDVLIGFDACP